MIRTPGQRSRVKLVVNHAPPRNARVVATEKMLKREHLGTLVKHARKGAGFKTQAQFAKHANLGPRVITKVETGDKVEPATLRAVELALGWPEGYADQILTGAVNELPASTTQPRAVSVLTMSRTELAAAAMVVEEVYGEEAGDRFLRDALEKRAQASRTGVRDQAG